MYTKEKSKIFVDGYLLNKEHQGTKTYIIELYKEFAKNNPNFLIYIGCFKDKSLGIEFSKYDNVKFIYYKYSRRAFRMIFEIPKLIYKYKFNYAHFQYVIPLFRLKTCSYIVTIHDILFNDFPEYFSFIYRLKRNFLFKYSAKKSDILITVSEYSKYRIQQVYNLFQKEIFITPNAVNKDFLKNYDKQESVDYIFKKYGVDNYILYVSRIEPRKNQQALLTMFPDLEDLNLNIVFIGNKTINNNILDKEYDNLSADLKERVHFFDSISNDDLLEFYKAAKVFIYPTFAEGFGIPPLEAGALKIPVICSKNTALYDFKFFEPYHIAADNIDLLKNKLIEILNDKNEENLVKIQNHIKEKYSWEKSSQILMQAIAKKK